MWRLTGDVNDENDIGESSLFALLSSGGGVLVLRAGDEGMRCSIY